MKRRVAAFAGLLPLLLLAGCGGGEPSDADILKALQADAAKSNQTARSILGQATPEAMQTKVLSAKKVACAEDKPGWKCTVNLSIHVPILGQQDRTSTVKLVKGDKGWVVTE